MGVTVTFGVTVGPGATVGVGVGVAVGVGEAVDGTTAAGVPVGVGVAVAVAAGVGVEVAAGVGVTVAGGVATGVGVMVGVSVGAGVAVGVVDRCPSQWQRNKTAKPNLAALMATRVANSACAATPPLSSPERPQNVVFGPRARLLPWRFKRLSSNVYILISTVLARVPALHSDQTEGKRLTADYIAATAKDEVSAM